MARREDDEFTIGHCLMEQAWSIVFYEPCHEKQFEQVIELSESASEIGRRIGDDFLASFSIYAIAICSLLRGDPKTLQKRGEQLLLMANKDENLMARQIGLAALAWMSVFSDDPEAALTKANEALSLTTTPHLRMQIEALRGAALLGSGDITEGYRVLRDARNLVSDSGMITALAGIDTNYGLSIFLNGDFMAGVKWLSDRQTEYREFGFQPAAVAIYDLVLGEIL